MRVGVSAAYLMRHPIAEAVALVHRVANAMGKVARLGKARLAPAMEVAFTAHWYPIESLVLEAGALPVAAVALDSGTFGMWAGTRARVPVHDSVVVSLGAAAGVWIYAEREHSLAGPRAAVEWVLPSRRDVVRVEAQYAHGDFVTPSATRWHPWGGLGYTAWF